MKTEHSRLKALIVLSVSLALLCACDLPNDQKLITRFSQKRPGLERIRLMIDEDNLEGRIHEDYADPQLPSSRLDSYRTLLRDIGVMRLWAHGKSKPFELIVAGTGFLGEGDYKGYLYDPAPQNPTAPSLNDSCFEVEEISDTQRFCSAVRNLDKNWWLIRYEYR
jgi:hypothetical protein